MTQSLYLAISYLNYADRADRSLTAALCLSDKCLAFWRHHTKFEIRKSSNKDHCASEIYFVNDIEHREGKYPSYFTLYKYGGYITCTTIKWIEYGAPRDGIAVLSFFNDILSEFIKFANGERIADVYRICAGSSGNRARPTNNVWELKVNGRMRKVQDAQRIKELHGIFREVNSEYFSLFLEFLQTIDVAYP